MDDLKLIFASNLIKLRTEAGYTQAELAAKINYSDKSISKWERGEAIPDAYVLKMLSEIFHVSVDDLLNSDSNWKSQDADYSRKVEYSQLSIILTSVVGIFTICLLEFIIVWAVFGKFHWIGLYAAVPISLIALLVLNSIWYKGRHNMYIVASLVLTLILLVYFIVLAFKNNFWQILILIIPAEIIVYLAFHIRRHPHLKKSAEKLENTELS